MPKIKDFMPAIKGVLSLVNPVASVVVQAVETTVNAIKPKKEVKPMALLQGKKTYIGIVIAAAPIVAKLLGYDLGDNFGAELEGVINELVSAVGLIIAAYGRAKTFPVAKK